MARPPQSSRSAQQKNQTPARPRHYLREWRKYRTLTQEQLSGRIDVSRGLIAQYENGTTKIPEDMLYALADALQCAPWDLFRVNPLKEGDVVDITDELRGLSDSDRSEALGYIRGLKSRSAG